MTPSLEALADLNFIESIREHARWQTPGELIEEDGLILFAGCNDLPTLCRNCAIRVDPNLSATAALERARDFFGSRRRGFTIVTRDRSDADLVAVLTDARLTYGGDAPCMLITEPLADKPLPADITTSTFQTLQQVLDSVEVNADAYALLKLPPQEARLFFSNPEALLSPRVAGFVAYRHTLPAATALTIFSGEGAGIYWVGTRAADQGRGLGELCTRFATNSGFAHGARVVTLQASPMGEPIYARLGYQTYDRVRRFMQLPNK